jgi:hypothetical protein
MRVCEPEFALENVWHVLDVIEGSPAESAGLVPYGDYIIGWAGGVLSSENDFYDLVEAVCAFGSRWTAFRAHEPSFNQHIEKPLRVYVYSYDFEYAPFLLLEGVFIDDH